MITLLLLRLRFLSFNYCFRLLVFDRHRVCEYLTKPVNFITIFDLQQLLGTIVANNGLKGFEVLSDCLRRIRHFMIREIEADSLHNIRIPFTLLNDLIAIANNLFYPMRTVHISVPNRMSLIFSVREPHLRVRKDFVQIDMELRFSISR